MQKLKTVGAYIQFNKVNKEAKVLAFISDIKRQIIYKNIVCLFVRFKGKGGWKIMKEKIQKKEEKMIKENKRNNASCTGSNNNNTCNISYHKYKHSI